jgi:hypothetical protein
VLRRRVIALALSVATLLVAGTAAHAQITAPFAGPVHGFCNVPAADVTVSGTSSPANGTGNCGATGVSTQSTAANNGRGDAAVCPVRVGSGTATLSLDAFGQVVGSARIVTSGASASIVVSGGLAGAGTFLETPLGQCATQIRWNGTLVF